MIHLTGEVTIECDDGEEWSALTAGIESPLPGITVLERIDETRFLRLSVDQDMTGAFIPEE